MSRERNALARLWPWLLTTGLLAGAPAAAGADVRAAAAAPTQGQIQLVLPLKVDEAGLSRLALAISTPGSPDYRKYESVAQLASRFGASPATRRRVLSWLSAQGATGAHVDSTGSLAEASMPLAEAARAFAVPGAVTARSAHGAFAKPRVPSALAGAATAVFGLDDKPLPISSSVESPSARPAAATPYSSQRTRTGTPAGCAAGRSAGEVAGDPTTAAFTPNQYLTAYGFDPLHRAGLRGQGQRVALIEFDGIRMSDLRKFARCFHLPSARVKQIKVGRKRLAAPGGEATVDTEVLDAAAPKLAEIDLYETRPTVADLLKALAAPLQRKGDQPQVISVSLGACERDTYAALGKAGVATWEFELRAAAASGSTVLAATGDTGSSGCQRGNGQPVPRLAVNFPASSPFVTAVGGTNLVLKPDNQIEQEIVWNDGQDPIYGAGAGGGGFSAKFGRPGYQNGVVRRNARALPDVSLLADSRPGYAIYCTAQGCLGAWSNIGGTSAAAPLFAGGVALMDQRLHAQDRQYVGFLNPLLYRIGKSPAGAQVFHDVTQGNNDVGPLIPGGHGHSLGCCSARRGFDEASGWGSVNFANLLARVENQVPKDLPRITAQLPEPQNPLGRRGLVVRVGCSARCDGHAAARIAIGRSRSFGARSSFHLARAGSRLLELRFTSAQVRALRTAFVHHVRVVVVAFAALTGAKHRLLETSDPVRLRLSG